MKRLKLVITKEQSVLLMSVIKEAERAQERRDLVFGAVVGGHGYSGVPVVKVDPKERSITIELPDDLEEEE